MYNYLHNSVKRLSAIQSSLYKFQNILFLVLLFPSPGYSQSLIKGNVYFYDSNEPAAGYYVVKTDSLKTDSVKPVNALGDVNGNFIIKNISNEKVDLQFSFVGYRKTIVKNIYLNKDTIDLNKIPLFIEDNVIYGTIVENKKYLWGLFRKTRYYPDTIGTEGPFTYKDRLYIICNAQDSILYERQGRDICTDYDKIKTCGNK